MLRHRPTHLPNTFISTNTPHPTLPSNPLFRPQTKNGRRPPPIHANLAQRNLPALSATNPSHSASGKTVLITGGGRGIGATIASSFLAASASHIILLGRSAYHLQSVRDDLSAKGGSTTKIHIYPTDITSASAVETTFATIRTECPPIDILVSNAGYLPTITPTASADVAEWWRGFEVNVLGTFLVVRAFLAHKAERSVIVNVSTGVAHIPAIPGGSGYGTSKNAGVRFLEFVAAEEEGVRVVNVHPGVVETEMYVKSEMVLPNDDVKLPAEFVVWVASPEGEFLKDSFVWVNWDIEELKAMKEEISKGDLLKMGLRGWPRVA